MTTRLLFGQDVELNTLTRIQFDESKVRITYADYHEALAHAHITSNKVHELFGSPAMLYQWQVSEKGEYTGAWAKRFAKVLKSSGQQLEESTIAVISERIYSSIRGWTEDVWLEFTDHANWRAGEFGDYDSCWFEGAQNHSRRGLVSSGGGAVRIYYANQEPRARAWYAPIEGGANIAIFNPYDKARKFTIQGVARMIASQYNTNFKRMVGVYLPGSYLNGGESAYVLGNPIIGRPVTFNFGVNHQVDSSPFMIGLSDIPPEPRGNKQYRCAQCDDVEVEFAHTLCDVCAEAYFVCDGCDDVYGLDDSRTHNDDTYCADCFYENYFYCAHCGGDEENDEGFRLHNDELVCRGCFDEDCTTCVECEDYSHYKEDANWTVDDDTNDSYCPVCAERVLTCCDRCGGTYKSDSLSTVEKLAGKEAWCETCKDHAHYCRVCDKLHPDNEDDHLHHPEEEDE